MMNPSNRVTEKYTTVETYNNIYPPHLPPVTPPVTQLRESVPYAPGCPEIVLSVSMVIIGCLLGMWIGVRFLQKAKFIIYTSESGVLQCFETYNIPDGGTCTIIQATDSMRADTVRYIRENGRFEQY